MNMRGTLVIIFGLMQSAIAGLVLTFACCLYFNFFGVQGQLNGAIESCYFHFLVLLVFGFFSIISGLFLVYEWLGAR